MASENFVVKNGIEVTESGVVHGNLTVDGTIFGDLVGVATKADALFTPFTIQLTGDVQGSVLTDGTGTAFISTSVLPGSVQLGVDTFGTFLRDVVPSNGVIANITGSGDAKTLNISTDAISTNAFGSIVKRDSSGNFAASVITAALNGNAGTASKLFSPFTLTLGNHLSGSIAIDGSNNVTLNANILAGSHNHNDLYYTKTESDANYLNVLGDSMSGALSFGSTYRQSINLYGAANAVGVQTGTSYFRSSEGFAWYVGGVHSDAARDAGAGGVRAMYYLSNTLYVNEQKVWTQGNDGAGSGLDADLLDGLNSTQFFRSDSTASATILSLATSTKSLRPSSTWQDTTIVGADLVSGTYIIQMTSPTGDVYSGTMTWDSATQTTASSEEITLHRAGFTDPADALFLRTFRNANETLKLQISSVIQPASAGNYVFKFRRII